jgi:hypothetical protein
LQMWNSLRWKVSCGKGMAAEFKYFSSPHTNTGSLSN